MTGSEWSRSRFWLSFFLHNRHERSAIVWPGPDRRQARPTAAVLGYLASSARHHRAGIPESRRPLISTAVARCVMDPAFVQSLRLMAKEEAFHHQLRARTVAALGEQDVPARQSTVWPRLRCLLGLRFELSWLLLEKLTERQLHRLLERSSDDPTLRSVCAQITRDQRAHLTFLAERLTMAYADFNFIRRNLRRLRLRCMYATMLVVAAVRHRRFIRDCNDSPVRFIADGWADFTAKLERVVPYRRDALLAALMHQRERPYEEMSDV